MAAWAAMRNNGNRSRPSIDGLEVHESSWNEWLESGGVQPEAKELDRARSQSTWLHKLLGKKD
jgi:hypothetical protein